MNQLRKAFRYLVLLALVANGPALAGDSQTHDRFLRTLVHAIVAKNSAALDRLLTPRNVRRLSRSERVDLMIGLIDHDELRGLAAAVQAGVDPNQPIAFDRDGEVVTFTPLNYAIASHQDGLAAIRLIELGADANGFSVDDDAPLLTATGLRAARVVNRLLTAGAKPNVRDRIVGVTPLMVAVARATDGDDTLASAKALVARGADLDATTTSGHTALMFAALYGNDEAAQWLIQSGADASLVADGGVTYGTLAAKPSELRQTLRHVDALLDKLKIKDPGVAHE